MKYVFFDIECAGVRKTYAKICVFGYVVCDENFNIIEKEDLLVSENIHVYQFVNEEQGKSVVEELEFRKAPCTGYDFSLFNDSMMNLFEEAKVAMGIEDED